jgi:non-homologous end joining protein Ku
MASRGTRNTAIAFGGFEISVALAKAHRSRDIKTEVVDADGRKVSMGGAGGRRQLRPDEQRAVRVAEDRVTRLSQDELDRIEQQSKDRYEQMQVLETIDYRMVPTERILGSYWLQPAAGSASTLALLAVALRRTGKVAVVKWCASSREKLGVIRVRGAEGHRALLLSELAFCNDFAAADDDALEINNVELDERSIGVAVSLLESFARPSGSEPLVDTASDEAVDARLALFERLSDAEVTRQLEESVAAVEDGATILDLEAARRAA